MSSSSDSVGKHYVLAVAVGTAIPGFIAFIAAIAGLCFLVGRRHSRPPAEDVQNPHGGFERKSQGEATESPRPTGPSRPTGPTPPTEPSRPTEPICPPAAKAKIDHYIENHFPIYLIHLPDKKLWRRRDVANSLKREYADNGGPEGERAIEN
jgi:hypothetical protein